MPQTSKLYACTLGKLARLLLSGDLVSFRLLELNFLSQQQNSGLTGHGQLLMQILVLRRSILAHPKYWRTEKRKTK